MPEPSQEILESYIKKIQQTVGENAQIQRAPSGLVNTVFLVDEQYVFRFPRDSVIYAQQIFERDVCSYLAERSKDLPISILTPLSMPTNNCFVYKYIPGAVMDEQTLLALSPVQQQAFVDDLLIFIFWLGETLKPDTYRQIASQSKGIPIESWEEYISRTVNKFNDPKFPALLEVNHDLLEKMEQHYPEGIASSANRVIHDDLHMGNLLFKDNKLSGIIDFGNTMIGDLACELRHFYRLSPALAEQAVSSCRRIYGEEVENKKIAWWAKINDAATLSEKIMLDKIGSPSYERALGNLAKWYPDKNWHFNPH
jgi:aminoglycoside phosphotransferase (APT) family kinase protein